MIADRELLMLAAKAAGYSVHWVDKIDVGHTDDHIVPLKPEMQHFSFDEYPYKRWDPLADDGQALRLAMTLAAAGKLRIQVTGDDVTAFQHWDGVWVPITWTFDAANPCEAFRRAIARAAAEIGRAK